MATMISATIGTTKLKMCEIDCSKNQPYIEKAITVDLPQGYANDGRLLDIDGLSAFIKEVLASENMQSKEITFVLKSSKVVYKEVYTPVLKKKKLKDFIVANASDYFPMDINDYVIADKFIAEVEADGEKQMRMGLYAAAKEMVEAYYVLGEKLGLIVKNVECYNNATVSFLSRQVDAETSVVIYVHDDSTTVNVYKNNILELQRNVPYGRDLVVKAVMENMDVSKEEAENLLKTKGLIHSTFDGHAITESLRYFVNGVMRVVDYYTSRSAQNTIEKVYLTGESMGILGLESLLVNEFFHNTEQIKKFRYIGVASNFRFEASMISKYISCVGGIYDPINFQSEVALQKRKNERNSAYLLIGFIGALAIGIILVAIPFLERLSLKNDIADYKNKVAALKGIETIVDNYYDSEDKVKDVTGFLNMANSPNDYLLEFIGAMEKGMPSHISLRSVAVENGKVTLSAVTSTKPTIAKFITQLKDMPGVDDPYVSSLSENKDAFGVISTNFSITFTFNSEIAEYLEDKQPESEEAPADGEATEETEEGVE